MRPPICDTHHMFMAPNQQGFICPRCLDEAVQAQKDWTDEEADVNDAHLHQTTAQDPMALKRTSARFVQ